MEGVHSGALRDATLDALLLEVVGELAAVAGALARLDLVICAARARRLGVARMRAMGTRGGPRARKKRESA